MSVWEPGDELEAFGLFWFEVAAELLLVAMSDTMDVGEVVSDELEAVLDAELVDEDDELELVEVRMVDEVTEVGGVPADESSEPLDGGDPAAR